MYKKMKYSLLALLAVMGLASCSNDYEYTPAGAESGNKVFFPAELLSKSSYNLDLNATSFDIQIERTDTVGELTVALENRQNVNSTTQLTVPESVTFANGEKTATITIAYDPSTIEFDDVNRDTLIIASSELLSEYSASEYRFSVSIAAPWTPWVATKTEWTKLGYSADKWPLSENESTCTYTYNECPFSSLNGPDPELPILYRMSLLDPTQAQILIQHWANNVDLVLDYNPETHNVKIPMNYIGIDEPELGPFYMTDVAHWQEDESWYEKGYPCTYNPETGLFVLSVAYVTAENACYGYGTETIQLDGFYVPDYSADASFAGFFKNAAEKNYAVVDFTLGRDVAVAKYAMTDASKSESAAVNAILSGEIEATEISKGDRVYIDLAEDGKYRATIVTFDAEGNAQESASATFEFEAGGSSWNSIGIGLWTDDFMTLYQGIAPLTYEVEVFANEKKPGIYRLKNPYGEAYPENESGDWDESMDYYLEINAEDPTSVYIEKQALGVDWGMGMMSIESDGAYYLAQGYDVETIKANVEGAFGTLENGVISFSTPQTFTIYMNGKEYYGNNNGACKLVLPSATAGMKGNNKAAKKSKRNNSRSLNLVQKNDKVIKSANPMMKQIAPITKLR